jgi:PEP-CTERM motif
MLRGRIGVSASVYFVALVCAALATQLTFQVRHHILWAHATTTMRAQAAATLASVNASDDPGSDLAAGRKLEGRPLYPYSVIPGGAANPQELKISVQHDPVVAAHYADFNIENAHVVHQDADRPMYVSYRLGDRVFWTTKALVIHKGEKLLSDGGHLARTRCGNRLSETPVAPISPEQPPAEVLAAPEAPILFAGNYPSAGFPLIPPAGGGAGTSSSSGSPPGGGGGIIPPPVYPIVGGGPPHTSTPPVTVPEPGSGMLLAAGLLFLVAVFAVASVRRMRKA